MSGQQLDYRAKLKIAEEQAENLGARGVKERVDWLIQEIDGNRPESLIALSSGDLYSLMDVNGIVEGIKVKHSTPIWLGILEWVRNLLVLVPLLLTWYEISKAAAAYQEFLQTHQDQFQVPILYLWQTGFGGKLTGPFTLRLGDLATVDAFLLLILIGLTFFVSWRTHIINAFKEDQAEQLRAILADALARTSLAIATIPANVQHPVNFVNHFERIVRNFERIGQELLAQMQQEHQLLDRSIQQGQRNLADLSQQVAQSAAELKQAAQATQGTSLNFDRTSTRFSQTADKLEQMVALLGSTNQALERTSTALRDSVTTLAEAVRTLDATQQKVGEHLEKVIQGLTTVANKQGDILIQQTHLLNRQDIVVQKLDALKQSVDQSINTIRQDAGALKQEASNVIGALGAAAQTVGTLVGEIKALNQQQRQYVADLRLLQADQRNMVNQLTTQTTSIVNDMKNIEQYLAALPLTLQGIWDQAGLAVQHMGGLPHVVQQELQSILNAHYDAAGNLRNASKDLRDAADKLNGP